MEVSEEYANAFRTESYNDFWTRVLASTNKNTVPMECTTAERLPSYRLFAEHLLEPDQQTITKILNSTQPKKRSENHILLVDYFSETANASQLCGLLLKHIDQTRKRYRPLKTTFDSLATASGNHCPVIFNKLTEFSSSVNPFDSTSSPSTTFRAVQAGCNALLKRLELSRKKMRAKLKLIKRCKRGLAIFAVALTATMIVVIVAGHVLVMLVTMPSFLATTLKSKRLACISAQLDAAAKGTYILNKDLETISRHVVRLNDEIEHVRAMVAFWLERKDGELKPSREVMSQFKKNDSSFMEQLDELEEHLYLCFMTINRARNLVMKEVLEFSRILL